jgi:hypothetical protein
MQRTCNVDGRVGEGLGPVFGSWSSTTGANDLKACAVDGSVGDSVDAEFAKKIELAVGLPAVVAVFGIDREPLRRRVVAVVRNGVLEAVACIDMARGRFIPTWTVAAALPWWGSSAASS